MNDKPLRLPTYKLVRKEQDDLRYALLAHYQANEWFMHELEGLRRGSRRLLHCLVFWKGARSTGNPCWSDLAWSSAQRAAEVRGNFLPVSGAWREGRAPHLSAYLRDIESLAKRWGLRSPWASSWLHAALLWPVFMSRIGSEFAEIDLTLENRLYGWFASVKKLAVELDVNEWDSWEDVQERIYALARPQYERIRAEVDGAGTWRRVRRKPQRSEHIRWLYDRICPGETGQPKGWHAIAQNAHTSHLTVRNAVLDLAGQMEIDLPDIPPGRPRRFPYRSSDGASS